MPVTKDGLTREAVPTVVDGDDCSLLATRSATSGRLLEWPPAG